MLPSYDPSWELQSCTVPCLFQLSNHFSKPPPRVFVSDSGHFVRSGSFVYETLVGTRTLHPKNSSFALTCLTVPVSITRTFLKASSSSYLVHIRPRQSLRTICFGISHHCNRPPVKRRCRDSRDGSAEPSSRHRIPATKNPKSCAAAGTHRRRRDSS